MEKEISTARARRIRTTVVIVSMLGVFLMWPLNQVGAATVERVLPPYEVLNEGKPRLVTDFVGNGSDATLYLDPVNLGSSRGMLNQHGLLALLSSTERSEGNYALFAPYFGAIDSKKSNAIEKQGKMSTSRAAKILDHYPHGDRTAGFHVRRPVFNQANPDHRTSRTHSLLKLGALKILSISSDDDRIHRSLRAAMNVDEGDYEQQDARQRQPQIIPSPKRRFFGPLSGLPLGAQIAIAILITLFAWPLYRVFQWTIDKSLATDGPYGLGFTALGFVIGYFWLASVTYAWASATYGIL